ncbi:response regulator [Fulvivirgaceae bacterium PWU4]|uniref:Response regulator n=1 Tax=Chryseosolibacter histidini TaxID=2782349 RepID=A0AAP2DP96_9BACT|nr:response regulator [Chryseosolibacter histidini]MBT1698833.1 response regulator [Chryseosolibacter histidini]
MNSASILIIDDETQIRKLLTITLQSNGYKVLEATTGGEGLKSVAQHPPDLVLLDLGLPDENGHEVLRHLREWFSNPVIIVSVQSSEEDIVKALDNGANDYLVKPFRTGELLARIRSALRKSDREDNIPVAEFQGLSIDFVNRVVKKDNVIVKLTATEYSLLALLVQNEGKVLTHHYLLNKVWGPSHQDESQYLRVFIARLRKKIETDPNRPVHILTESGVGYRFIAHNPDDL